MKYFIGIIFGMVLGCTAMKSPLLLKYKNEVMAVDQKVSRGEITAFEADNLKLQAQQNYLEARRNEEKLFASDVDRQIKSQNQEISSALRQNR